MTAANDAQSGDFTYTASNGVVTVTGYTGTSVTLDIPHLIDGNPVTAIGSFAFAGNTRFKAVTLPSSLVTIGSSAFSGCTSLLALTIPYGLSGIGSFAFNGCSSLESIIIPETVTSIASFAFNECSRLISVSLPTTLTSIGASSFRGCVSLVEITFPETLSAIGDQAFNLCSSLSIITIPAGVKVVGASAFLGCGRLASITVDPSNPFYSSAGGVLYDKAFATLIQCPGAIGGTVTVRSETTSIGSSAFFGCISVSAVIMPSSVTSIGRSAFRGCISLVTVDLPPGLTTLGDHVFYKCSNLERITLPATLSSIGQFAFYDCNALTEVVIPNGVRGIGDFAFTGCNRLVSVAIPGSVTGIGGSSFRSCKSLLGINVDPSNGTFASVSGVLFNKSLSTLLCYPGGKAGSYVIPSSVTTLAAYAFYDSARLTSVSIPEGVTTLRDLCFAYCSGLTSISIPSSVTTITGTPFRSCMSLSSIAVSESNASYASSGGVLFNKTLTTLMQCPGGLIGDYAIPVGVMNVASYAFYDCVGISSVHLPATVASFGTYAVTGCSLLTSISVDPANTTYSSAGGILYTKAITSLIACPGAFTGRVVIPDSVTALAPAAFSGCNGVESVVVPAAVTTVGYSAFNQCVRLTAVYFNGNRPSFSTDVFTDSQATVYRTAVATGWSLIIEDVPVKVFQLCEVNAGQVVPAAVSDGVDRLLKIGLGTAVLKSPSSHSGGTVVEAGEIVVQHAGAFGGGSLGISAGGRVSLQIGVANVTVASLRMTPTSRLDIGTGRLTVASNTLTENELRASVIAGRNRGAWNGATGIRSLAAGSDGSRAVGYRVTGGGLEVAYAAPGDSNLDGIIDILDLGEILSAGKFNTGDAANWTQGDTNYDGVFDILDLSEILGTGLFNQGNYLTQPAASSAAVESRTVASFDHALVFAAMAVDPVGPTTTKRKFA